ncbi:glycosyltransferase [Pedobacter cryoconitis]|uniref:Alpha-1,3-rhamnosyltransferase n=1 Tax=Pedobacter cryoconitis TaxID=188932 RepID=A0A7X0MKR0_9SPHI|nr:glycosyltransferase [Pedobacter cryoconitis]MBB6500975.1 alpha-1,3-rhamnosyltransferase [Pedobacter cryoconitis]
MKEPLVSIIVVSYNHGKFIRENLDSIKNQTYKNIQLIVGDDASSDGSVQVFEEWLTENNYPASKNYHANNTGLATMLNECIEMVEGEYVKMIAGDDYFSEDYIMTCVQYLETSSLQAVYTNAFSVDEESKVVRESYFPVVQYSTTAEMIKSLLRENFVPGSTLFLKANIFARIGKFPLDVLLEDYYLALQLARLNLIIGSVSDSLIYYRRHDSNITNTRFHYLEMKTIKQQLDFDQEGKYADDINRNIFRQVCEHNPHISELKKDYNEYKGRRFKVDFAIQSPLIYSFLLSMKYKCFPL